MTVVAHLLPLVWASIFLLIVFYAGCNTPSPKISILDLAGYSNLCQSVNSIAGGLTANSLNLSNPAIKSTTVAGSCSSPLSGDASIAYMSTTCFGSLNANTAAIVASHESGGNPTIPSGVDVCRDASGNKVMVNGSPAAVSFGLFQINITSHKIGSLNCPAAFAYPPGVAVREYDANNHQCSIVDQNLYNNCVQAAEDPAQNINQACIISSNGINWNAWKADINACGISPSS